MTRIKITQANGTTTTQVLKGNPSVLSQTVELKEKDPVTGQPTGRVIKITLTNGSDH